MKYQIIENFLDPEFAAEVASCIYNAKGEDWKHYYQFGGDAAPFYFENTIANHSVIVEAQQKLGQSLQDGHFTYRLKRLDRCVELFCSCALCKFKKNMLSERSFLDYIGQLSSKENLELVEAFASVYYHGDFLSIHPDPNFDVAFILNLSKDWKYEYGGCLTVFDEEDEHPKVILPKYNSLVLLYLGEKGVDHYISEVSSLAPHSRIAVSGWFNAPEK
jgi:Rps23 Pro-64 3,4-dihydroxylase Tpa1-like proline 4-hydroxylase